MRLSAVNDPLSDVGEGIFPLILIGDHLGKPEALIAAAHDTVADHNDNIAVDAVHLELFCIEGAHNSDGNALRLKLKDVALSENVGRRGSAFNERDRSAVEIKLKQVDGGGALHRA